MKLLILIAMLILTWAINIGLLYYMWNMVIVDLVSLPVISIFQAVGLWLFVQTLRLQFITKSVDK